LGTPLFFSLPESQVGGGALCQFLVLSAERPFLIGLQFFLVWWFLIIVSAPILN
jgi:hypothetical protein